MRVHWLQHARADDLGCIAPWLASRGAVVSRTRFSKGEAPPALDSFDELLIMGGAMNVDQVEQYPWLVDEKRYIAEVLQAGKRVLGICLGAQLLAEQMGAAVTRNRETEIGWFPVQLTDAGRAFAPFADLPDAWPAFHWHGDTFALPPGATRLVASEACAQQGFVSGDGRVLALQFHPEVTAAGVRVWLKDGLSETGPYVQTAEEMLGDLSRFGEANRLLFKLLDRWIAVVSPLPHAGEGAA